MGETIEIFKEIYGFKNGWNLMFVVLQIIVTLALFIEVFKLDNHSMAIGLGTGLTLPYINRILKLGNIFKK